MQRELAMVDEIVGNIPGVKFIEPAEPAGATGSNLPYSIGTNLDEVSRFCHMFAESSQKLPVTRPERPPRFHGNLSTDERTKRLKSKLRQLALRSSRKPSDRTPGVSKATVTTQSNEQGARPKDPVQHAGSSDLQTEPFKQGIRQSSDQKASASTATVATQSNEQGARPKDPVQHAGSSNMQTEPFKQDIRQSTSDSLGKQSSDRKDLIAAGSAQYYGRQGARPKDRVQNTESSDVQTGEPSGTSGYETVE